MSFTYLPESFCACIERVLELGLAIEWLQVTWESASRVDGLAIHKVIMIVHKAHEGCIIAINRLVVV